MRNQLCAGASAIAVVSAAMLAVATPAFAASRHHATHAGFSHPGVRFAHAPQRGGYQALVSDGPGTGFGFHRLPLPYSVAAVHQQERQSRAVRDAVGASALDSTGFREGFPGDSVYGAGSGAAYGVFNGADGYGSPYFAGYYGPGDGQDYGVFGHAYTD
jgi:hypothetical protein